MVTYRVLTNIIGAKADNKLSGFGLYISHGKGQETLFCFSCTVSQGNLAGREETGTDVSRS